MRICLTLVAAMLGLSGAFYTWASFDDPSAAEDAVMVLLPCAFLVWSLPTTSRCGRKTKFW